MDTASNASAANGAPSDVTRTGSANADGGEGRDPEPEPSSPGAPGEPPAIPPGQALVPVAPPPARGPSLLKRLLAALWPDSAPLLRSDLESALAEAGEDGFSPEERALLRNILQLREQRVVDVMIPRSEVIAIEASATLADALECFEESGHSRLPVYGETLDDPHGMIHIRDVMDHIVKRSRGRRRAKAEGNGAKPNGSKANGTKGGNGKGSATPKLDLGKIDLSRTIAESKLLREVLFVPPSMPAVDLMALMQARRIQMALVIDEYGGTDGLASLEDVVESIVGDIEDEHDDAEEMIVANGANTFEMDGRAELDDVGEALGISLADDGRDGEIDTLGGLIFVRLGRVPARGEVVQVLPGYEVQVLEADARRIRRVRVTRGRSRARPRRRPEGNARAA